MSGDYQTIIDAGRLLGEPKHTATGGEYIVLRDQQGRETVHDLEHLEDNPSRIRAQVVTHETTTFIDYVKSYANEGAAIFADGPHFAITGMLDYHCGPGGASWCTHRVLYTAPRSTEWVTWSASNGIRKNQTDFAQFIEDNVIDIRKPLGADVLEVARNLQAKKAVEFSSAIRPASGGHEFTYNEAISGSASKGKLAIPETFTLGIPVFRGGISYEVIARLRYRIDGGKLQLWYDLYRPEVIEADAFKNVTDVVGKETGITIWQGVPPS